MQTALYATGNANMAADGAEPERVPRASVSRGFFSVLGVPPVIGRAFLPEEDRQNAEPVAILLACYLPARRAAKLDPMKALARG